MRTKVLSEQPSPWQSLLAGDGAAKALFLSAAVISFFLSIGLWFTGDRQAGMFVGLWVPSICSAGALILARRRDV